MPKKKPQQRCRIIDTNTTSTPSTFSIFDFLNTSSSTASLSRLLPSREEKEREEEVVSPANNNCNNANTTTNTTTNDFVFPVTDFPPMSSFTVSKTFPALIVPVRRTNEIRKILKSIILSRPGLSVVVKLTENDDGEHHHEVIPTVKNNNIYDKNDNNSNSNSNNIFLKLTSENRKDYRKIILDPKLSGIVCSNTDDASGNVNGTTMINSTNVNKDLKLLLIAAANVEDDNDNVNDDDNTKNVASKNNNSCLCYLSHHKITLAYDDWTTDEILTRLLAPEGITEIPSSFETVGRLSHVNLRKELIPYKYVIGKVLLDKNQPTIQTVVNKLSSIDTKYRTFGMEVIAGNADTGWSDVVVKEERCEYRLDFRKVYWNSRLGREHRRLVQLIQNDATNRRKKKNSYNKNNIIVADMMAGVGPFAVPLTAGTAVATPTIKPKGTTSNSGAIRKTATIKSSLPIEVYANDLNPASYEYLVINAKRNKCGFIDHNKDNTMDADDNVKNNKNCSNNNSMRNTTCKLHIYNMDARSFCHRLQDQGVRPDYYIMNLPATALEFLDAFRGYPVNSSGGSPSTSSSSPPFFPLSCYDSNNNKVNDDNFNHDDFPIIHVHCFAPKDMNDARRQIWTRIETALGCPLEERANDVVITMVRDVAPSKNMYCVSFRLPIAVSDLSRIQIATATTKHQGNDHTQAKKCDNVMKNEIKESEETEPNSKRIRMEG